MMCVYLGSSIPPHAAAYRLFSQLWTLRPCVPCKAIEDTDPGNATELKACRYTSAYSQVTLPSLPLFTDHTEPTSKSGNTDATLNTYTPEKFAEVRLMPLSPHLPPVRCTMRRITTDRGGKTEKKPLCLMNAYARPQA
jgi:hypothetical protein